MKLLAIIPFLVSIIFLSACSDDKEMQRDAKFQMWGKEFVIHPIQKGTPEQKEWAKAVAQIHLIEDKTGTGFFVSPNGLLLTNNHVVSKERCSAERCAGVQIIRDFHAEGEAQVYTELKVVAQSEELDFALIKVQLPEGQSVPFLELDFENQGLNEGQPLVVIGHPGNAPTRVTPMLCEYADQQIIDVKGPIFWGNSGSPMIDVQSGKVVGLVSRIDFGPHRLDRNGNIGARGQAIKVSAILDSLKRIYPTVDFSSWGFPKLNFDRLTADRSADTYKLLGPMDPAEHRKSKTLSLAAFIGNFFATPDEAVGLEKYARGLEDSLFSDQAFANQVSLFQTLGAKSGRRIQIPEAINKRVAGALQRLDDLDQQAISRSWQLVTGQLTTESCLFDPWIQESFERAVIYCNSKVNSEGKDVIDILINARNELLDQSNWQEYQVLLVGIYGIISARMNAGPLSAHQVEGLRPFFAAIIRDAESLMLAYEAEMAYLFLKKRPERIGKDSFKDTF